MNYDQIGDLQSDDGVKRDLFKLVKDVIHSRRWKKFDSHLQSRFHKLVRYHSQLSLPYPTMIYLEGPGSV